MNIEIRAEGVHISGYVNVTGKKSRPVITPHGKCIEVIEERAFERSIAKAGNVCVTVDHDKGHIYASTENSTLKLFEDSIGLHADVIISDPDLIDIAKKGKIKGWSFGMRNVIDELEQRADDLPIRHIKDLTLDHITLVVNKEPYYASTSVEVRADNEDYIECRAFESKVTVIKRNPTPTIDYSDYENRINKLKSV